MSSLTLSAAILLSQLASIAAIVFFTDKFAQGAVERAPSNARSAARAALSRLRVFNVLTGFGTAAAVVHGDAVWLGALLPIAPLLVAVAHHARQARGQTFSARFSVPLDPPPGATAFVHWELQAANVACVLFAVTAQKALIAHLPARVPLHVGTKGVDRWGPPDALWGVAGGFVMLLLVPWLVAFFAAKERWALPVADPQRGAALQFERRACMVRLAEIIALVSNVGLAAVWLGVAASARWPELMALVIVGSLMTGPAALIFLAFSLAPLARIDDELRALGADTAMGTRRDGWRWGGLVYFAPEDPALIVPKRIGIGQTLNFARPAAWGLLIGVLLLFLLVVLVPTLL